MQTFHFSPAAIATETKPPQQLCYCWTSANGCLVPRWSGVGGVVNKGEVLLWDEHCCTDKVVKEEIALCSFVIQQQNRIGLSLAQQLFWSGFRQMT